jgi:uncharacterized protein (TIGR04551 family)
MRWRRSLCVLITLCSGGSGVVQAQAHAVPAQSAPAEAAPPASAAEPAAPAPGAETPAPAPEGAAAGIPEAGAEPQPEPTPAASAEASETAPAALPPAPQAIPTPGEMEQLMNEQLPPSTPSNDWTAPTPVLTLHGYLRVRGELMDSFWLGRDTLPHYFNSLKDPNAPAVSKDDYGSPLLGQAPDPFSRFRPAEARPQAASMGTTVDCVDEDHKGDACDVSTLQFANMRLRLSPELALSEEVRIKATFDVLDNVVLGEPPGSFYGQQPTANGAPVTIFTGTDLPGSGGGGIGDSIKARRAWAEVSNRDLGELRFGRMAQQWGLGMVWNAGDGFDDDVSTDVDRVLGITNLKGIYLSAAYDFAAEGELDHSTGVPIDQSQLDDLDQFTFAVWHRDTPEELTAAKEKGELVLNGGLQLQLRNQDATYRPPDPVMNVADAQAAGYPGTVTSISATTYTPDLWLMLRYRGLRIEAEAAWVHGTMNDIVDGGTYDIDQFGYALETELRLLDEKLGLYIDHGLATGDSDVNGLSSDADFVTQQGEHNDGTVSTFRFHPDYRVDLILWRNIMQQVTGAYYIKPGISYDFIRNDFGQLLGARLDVLWSRATAFVQTWGNDPDLGVEVNVSLYYRTEDGPEIDDGYYAKLQYGVLFPMRGLAFRTEDTDLDTAQTLRLLLGVVY